MVTGRLFFVGVGETCAYIHACIPITHQKWQKGGQMAWALGGEGGVEFQCSERSEECVYVYFRRQQSARVANGAVWFFGRGCTYKLFSGGRWNESWMIDSFSTLHLCGTEDRMSMSQKGDVDTRCVCSLYIPRSTVMTPALCEYP